MLTLFVKIRRPIAIRSNPLMKDIALECFKIAFLYFINLPMASAVNINGIVRPKEYTHNKRIPFSTVSKLLAYISMEDKIGPMQGVQPVANAIPISKDPNLPEALLKEKNLFSL